MKTNPEARGPSIRLTEDILKKLGLTCIWLDRDRVHDLHTKLVLRTIVGRRAVGEKIWFRNERDAEKVQKACLSRCFEAERVRDGVMVKLPYDKVVGLIDMVAYSLGITSIKDADVATTFDSINRRIEGALRRMEYDGSMQRLNREYSTLRRGTSGGTIDGTLGQSPPPYQTWLADRLQTEILRCTDLAHLTKL